MMDLFFSGDGATGFRLRARDEITARSLRKLGKLCNVAPEECSGTPDAILTSTGVPEDAVQLAVPQKYRRIAYYRAADYGFYVRTPVGRTPGYFAFEAQKLMLFGHAMALVKPGNHFNLMHGALLENPDGTCTLLFGDSGVGKSTSVRRYRASGGVAVADDLFFAYLVDGKLYARPMPTWSAVAAGKNPPCYDFARSFPVKQLLLLLRDPKEEHIGEVSPEQFRLSLLKSIAETSNWILPFAGVHREKIVDHLMKFCHELVSQFPPQAFFANLNGDIRATLGQKNI